ncbi:MAG: hypothetical protein ACP5SH_23505, partial [Syntrophobacteraceae bacterium]
RRGLYLTVFAHLDSLPEKSLRPDHDPVSRFLCVSDESELFVMLHLRGIRGGIALLPAACLNLSRQAVYH